LIPIAEQYGMEGEAAELTRRVKGRLEEWLPAVDGAGRPKGARVFAYEKRWGTLIGYPAGFGSDEVLNDHHFHYGYFLRAAGEIARRDPGWASDARWGGMLKMIARDIAAGRRDDAMFPFLRNFDPYAGHSWAAGDGRYGDGNNEESSSEAMNAWYGLILLGQFTGDVGMRDLGVWLYTSEMRGIEEYWFDVTGENFARGYSRPVVTLVWGGKGVDGTWFSAEPEAIHAINYLPVTGGSLYLGRWPEYVERNWRGLLEERGGARLRQWQDVLWMYRALSDPQDALREFDAMRARVRLEEGNSMAGAYHWIGTLGALGRVDRGVTADYPLAATFVKDGRRTHVVYRAAGDAGREVRFSDGVVVPAGGEGFMVR
jgi:endoglucanase Acf2